MKWRFSSGSSVLLGIDSTIYGLESSLPPDLITFLHSRGIFTWNKLIRAWSSSAPIWMNNDDLCLPSLLRPSWELAVNCFDGKGITQTGSTNELVWSMGPNKMSARVKDLYSAASSLLLPVTGPSFPFIFWKSNCQLKAILFSWLLFSNRILSWEVLQRKGWLGLGRCSMCCQASESSLHMFFLCSASSQVWYDLSLSFGFPFQMFASVEDAFRWWSVQRSEWRSIFIYTCWLLWKWWNEFIFQDSKNPISSIPILLSAFSEQF